MTCLDEQDLKDIAEAKEDIRQGRVYTTEEVRARMKSHWWLRTQCPVCQYPQYTDGVKVYCSDSCTEHGKPATVPEKGAKA
jgi:hypothetical protein